MNRTLTCPLCQTRGKTNNLLLRQINLSSAVYLCEDNTCDYPMGYEWIEVQRSLDSLTLEIRQSTDVELDQWLEEVFENEVADTTQPANACESATESDDFLSEIFRGIENADYSTSAFDLNGDCTNCLLDPLCQISNESIGDLTRKTKAVFSFEGKDSCDNNVETKVENTPTAETRGNVRVDVVNNPKSKFQDFRFTSLVVRPARKTKIKNVHLFEKKSIKEY